MDEIVFLGTGGGRVVTVLQSRATGGIVLRHRNHQIHLDPGPGAIVRCKQYGIDPRKTDVICLSHGHTDHTSDVDILTEAMAGLGNSKRGYILASDNVADDPSTIPVYYRNYVKDIIRLRPGKGIKMGDLTIIGTETVHGNTNGIGFRFIDSYSNISYTSDTRYFDDMSRIYDGSDIIIFNVLRPGQDRTGSDHLCTKDVIDVINGFKNKPKIVIIQHFGMKMLRANPLMEAREIFNATNVAVSAVSDGQRINVRDIIRQQRMPGF
jgi:ribonuclease BN (tRNA processing enzyme)